MGRLFINVFKNILPYIKFLLFVIIVIGIISIINFFISYNLLSDEAMNVYKVGFYIIIISSFVVAYNQYNYNIKWNKEQLTAQVLNAFKNDFRNHSKFLHKNFKYRDLTSPLDVDEIHKKMGTFIEDMSKKQKKEIKSNKKVNISNKGFVYNKNGEKINDGIRFFLNDLEAMAGGINNKTYDETLSKKLLKRIFITAEYAFTPYLEHLYKDHNLNKNVYSEFLTLARKWKKEKSVEELCI